MHQKQDPQHPWKTYSEALEAVESEGEDGDESADEPADPPGGTPPVDGSADDRPGGGENPLLEAPDWKPDDGQNCPVCGAGLERIGEGRNFSGVLYRNGTKQRQVEGTTGRGDMSCDRCNLIVGNGGEVVRNVS